MSYNINDLEDLKKVFKKEGHHYFDKEAIEFFNSKPSAFLPWKPFKKPELLGYLIDSIQYDESSPRLWLVKEILIEKVDVQDRLRVGKSFDAPDESSAFKLCGELADV